MKGKDAVLSFKKQPDSYGPLSSLAVEDDTTYLRYRLTFKLDGYGKKECLHHRRAAARPVNVDVGILIVVPILS